MARKRKVEATPDLFLRLLQERFPGREIVKEHRFHPERKWRFDYAIPDLKIAVEVDGAVWTGGRHNRADCGYGETQYCGIDGLVGVEVHNG